MDEVRTDRHWPINASLAVKVRLSPAAGWDASVTAASWGDRMMDWLRRRATCIGQSLIDALRLSRGGGAVERAWTALASLLHISSLQFDVYWSPPQQPSVNPQTRVRVPLRIMQCSHCKKVVKVRGWFSRISRVAPIAPHLA